MKALFAIPLVTVIAGCAGSGAALPTQADVDLNRYMGTWYEQARLPNRFQKDCAANVQADYQFNPNNTISVTNQCRKKDGSTDRAEGEGRLSTAVTPRNTAILQVRFAPKWLAWLPMVWGDYWILKIQGDYEYSLVGTPDRNYLWVLSRDKNADKATVAELIDYAQTQGFDTSSVITAVD